jgi:hypothetical protein
MQIKAKNQAIFLFFINSIQVVINKGFASHDIAAPPVNVASQPINKASKEVWQPLSVQKQILKRDNTKSPIFTIKTKVLSFDFSSINICSSFEKRHTCIIRVCF